MDGHGSPIRAGGLISRRRPGPPLRAGANFVLTHTPTNFPTDHPLSVTDARNMPAYTPGDAAHYLHIPSSTVRC